MKKRVVETEVVKFGAARVLVRQRPDGLWALRWREAGKGRNTAAATRDKAMDMAKQKARALAGSVGGKLLTMEDAHLVERLKAVAGARSPFALLSEIEAICKGPGGWDVVGRALTHYRASGMGSVVELTLLAAKTRFLAGYVDARARAETLAPLRKELEAFLKADAGRASLLVSELTVPMLEEWIMKPRHRAGEVAAKTVNNRLGVWRTFLARCRDWQAWPKGERTPADLIKLQKEPGKMPQILTVAQAKALLAVVREKKPELLNYMVTGCWMGLRPSEMQRVNPAAWDWDRSYLFISENIALKTIQARYVPIAANVRAMLGGVIVDPRKRTKVRGWREDRICGTDDQTELSALARVAGIVEAWEPDVMRHSCISYWLAQGHSRSQVAEWAGNSEAIIRKRYRRPLRREDGDEWFAIGKIN